MADIINLRRVKKTKERSAARAQGDENAAKFGRTKAGKSADKAQADKARAGLDAHLRDKFEG